MLKYRLNTDLIREIIRSKDSFKRAFREFKDDICSKCGLCLALMELDGKKYQQKIFNKQIECFYEHFTK